MHRLQDFILLLSTLTAISCTTTSSGTSGLTNAGVTIRPIYPAQYHHFADDFIDAVAVAYAGYPYFWEITAEEKAQYAAAFKELCSEGIAQIAAISTTENQMAGYVVVMPLAVFAEFETGLKKQLADPAHKEKAGALYFQEMLRPGVKYSQVMPLSLEWVQNKAGLEKRHQVAYATFNMPDDPRAPAGARNVEKDFVKLNKFTPMAPSFPTSWNFKHPNGEVKMETFAAQIHLRSL